MPLSKDLRLSKRNDILLTLKKGHKVYGRLLSIKYLKSTNFKLLISVSKKISKKAVVRNLVRRRINGLFTNIWSKGGLDSDIYLYVQVIQNDLKSLNFDDLGKELEDLLAKIKKNVNKYK